MSGGHRGSDFDTSPQLRTERVVPCGRVLESRSES